MAEPRDVPALLVEYWNRRDSRCFGALFSDAGVYVAAGGGRYVGRAEIEGLVDQAAPGTSVNLVGPPTVEPRGTVAVVRFGWRSGVGIQPRRQGVITCELRFSGDAGWVIESLRNHETAV